jgi:putative transposase
MLPGMARRARNQTPGLIRHIMSRGNGRMRIFRDDDDYRQFVYVLGEAVERYDVACWNYCLMPNHYHLTLVPSRSNLSEAIRRVNSVYAQWWNRRHRRVGHVFQGRFKDQIVQREGYLLSLSRYVVGNPVRARLAARPEDWPWSSYRATAGLIPCPAFLDVKPTLSQFGEEEETVLRARFTRYVTEEREDKSANDRLRSGERVLGTRAFKASLEGRIESNAGDKDMSASRVLDSAPDAPALVNLRQGLSAATPDAAEPLPRSAIPGSDPGLTLA